jgi:hypothetical protein
MRLHNRLQTQDFSSQAGGREYHSTRSVDNNSKKSVVSFTAKGWPIILTSGLRIWGILAHNGRPAKLNQRIIFICWQFVGGLAKARSSSGLSLLIVSNESRASQALAAPQQHPFAAAAHVTPTARPCPVAQDPGLPSSLLQTLIRDARRGEGSHRPAGGFLKDSALRVASLAADVRSVSRVWAPPHTFENRREGKRSAKLLASQGQHPVGHGRSQWRCVSAPRRYQRCRTTTGFWGSWFLDLGALSGLRTRYPTAPYPCLAKPYDHFKWQPSPMGGWARSFQPSRSPFFFNFIFTQCRLASPSSCFYCSLTLQPGS